MNLEFVRKYFWLIKLVFVAGLAAELAMLASTRIEARLGAVPVVDLSSAKTQAGHGYVSLAEYEQILKKNVFNSAYVYVPETAKGEKQRAHDNFDLLGTVAWDPENAMAIIRTKASNQIDVYRVGDLILNQATVVSIERRRVTLERDKQTEVLEMPEDRIEVASAPVSDAILSGEAGITSTGDNHFVIDKAVVDAAFSNMGNMMRGAAVMPNLDKGKINGFKMSRIRSDSLYKKIGLLDGDIIHRINGIEFSGPEDALRMMSELKEAKNVSIDISRKDRHETLSYSIR